MSITHFKGNRSPSLTDTIRVNGAPFDLTGVTVRVKARFEDQTALEINGVAEVVSASTTTAGAQTLPASVIAVASTAGFNPSGALSIGGQIIEYEGLTATSFLRCSGGTGSVPNGTAAAQLGGIRYDWTDQDVDTAGELAAWYELTLTSLKTQDSPEFELVIIDHTAAAVTPTALVTLQAARQFVLRDPDDHGQDQKLAQSIAAFSKAVAKYTRREWLPRSTALTRRFWYGGAGLVRLAPFDLRALTSVTLYADMPTASQRVLVAGSSTLESEYRLTPAGQTDEGTYRAIRIAPEVSSRSAYEAVSGFEVAVAGDWGICATLADVPEDVQLACLIAVKVDYVNPEGFAARTLGDLSITEAVEPQADIDAGVTSLPSESRALLTPYKSGNPRFVYA